MRETKSLPKLVIFGDEEKQGVNGAIEEFVRFAEGKAEILARYTIEDVKKAGDDSSNSEIPAGPQAETLANCDFAIVFGGDGSIISTA